MNPLRQVIIGIILGVASTLPVAAHNASPLAQGLEKLATCGHGRLVQQATAAVEASPKFRQAPNHKGFYAPTSNIIVFGLKLRYVSLEGTKYQRGPVLIVEGPWPQLFKQLNSIPNMGFACMDMICWSKVSQHHVVMAGLFSLSKERPPTALGPRPLAIQCGYFAK